MIRFVSLSVAVLFALCLVSPVSAGLRHRAKSCQSCQSQVTVEKTVVCEKPVVKCEKVVKCKCSKCPCDKECCKNCHSVVTALGKVVGKIHERRCEGWACPCVVK